MLKNLLKTFYQINKLGWVLIVSGSLTWLVTIVKSGVKYSFGYGYWGANGHDGIWHVALIESLSKGSLQNPVFAGAEIQNYHIGFDILISIVHKLTFIPVSILYFQIIPIVMALGIGISAYLFVLKLTDSKNSAFWSTFFVYFGGSFGWIITFLRSSELGGESLFWSQQSISTLINPPFALSLLIIFIGLHLFLLGFEGNNRKLIKLASLLLGLLVIIKIYASILVLFGLFMVSMSELYFNRSTKYLRFLGSTLIISLLLFLPFATNYSVLELNPFWFLESMMAYSDRFNWVRYHSAMTSYVSGGDWLRASVAYFGAFVIFIIGNFGIRIIAVGAIFKWICKSLYRHNINIFIVSIIVCGIFIPMIFVQTGTPWNTIQFMYYSLIFSGVVSGIVLGSIFDRYKNKRFVALNPFIVLVILLFVLPTTYSTLKYNYIPSRPPAKLGSNEIEALRLLSDMDDGVVLTYPFDKLLADLEISNPPRPLYLYESTAYVSAYSKKTVFIEDEVNLNITGYDWKTRRQEVLSFFGEMSESDQKSFIESNNIEYIYLLNDQISKAKIPKNFSNVYQNDEVVIYSNNDN